MTGRIILSLALFLPLAGRCAPAAEEPLKALRKGDFLYLKMPRSLVALVRSPGWQEGAPESVATAGALKISPLRSLIRSPANILTAVDAKGQTREVEAGEDEIELLLGLGAQPTGKYGYALKRFLRLRILDPGPSLLIEAGEEKYRFAIEAAP